jgi:hypothetical protein
MKVIKNKTIALGANQEDPKQKQNITVAQLAKSCVNAPTKEGFSTDDMRKRIKILEVLENATDVISLEDTDFQEAVKCVKDMRWGICDKGIIEFCDLFEKEK